MTAIGGRRLQTTPPEHIAEGTTMSTLTIKNAQDSDSGTYTCEPSQLETAHVNLHVLECKFSGFIPYLSMISVKVICLNKETMNDIS